MRLLFPLRVITSLYSRPAPFRSQTDDLMTQPVSNRSCVFPLTRKISFNEHERLLLLLFGESFSLWLGFNQWARGGPSSRRVITHISIHTPTLIDANEVNETSFSYELRLKRHCSLAEKEERKKCYSLNSSQMDRHRHTPFPRCVQQSVYLSGRDLRSRIEKK